MSTEPTPDQSAQPSHHLLRFTLAERWVHRTVAVLMGVLMVTGALMFFPDLGGLVGNRPLVSTVHEISGWLLPVPLLLAIASRAFREDAGRLNRFGTDDWRWLRSRDRRSGRIPVGKFNAGQKLNAAFTLGAVIVMFGTGMVMFFSSQFPDELRTGATFVHDWLSLAVAVVVLGHLWMAFGDATARMGMRRGEVPLAWAEREHADWAREELARPAVSGARSADELGHAPH